MICPSLFTCNMFCYKFICRQIKIIIILTYFIVTPIPPFNFIQYLNLIRFIPKTQNSCLNSCNNSIIRNIFCYYCPGSCNYTISNISIICNYNISSQPNIIAYSNSLSFMILASWFNSWKNPPLPAKLSYGESYSTVPQHIIGCVVIFEQHRTLLQSYKSFQPFLLNDVDYSIDHNSIFQFLSFHTVLLLVKHH